MAGPVVIQLDDELAQVRFQNSNARRFQRVGQPGLLGRHGFDLGAQARPVLTSDAHDDLVGLGRGGRLVHHASAGLHALDELPEVGIEMIQCVLLDVGRHVAQRIEIRHLGLGGRAGQDLLPRGVAHRRPQGRIGERLVDVRREPASQVAHDSSSRRPSDSASTSARCRKRSGLPIRRAAPSSVNVQPASLQTTVCAPVAARRSTFSCVMA